MSLNWERLSLSGYIEALAAWSGEGEKQSAEPTDAMRRFMAAHSGK